ncbi:MAG: potassium transporter Kup [Alphaproteobacteria bacterium]|nr:potassium transporter Kup [Alphaproteobacteria bacterium]
MAPELTEVSLNSGGTHAAAAHSAGSGRWRTAGLTLGALGVVFGDIGTSPLYAMRQSVQAASAGLPRSLAALGCASLIFWALIIVVTIKYVTLIMRADNDGEGGSLALAALAHRSHGISRRLKSIIGIAALAGLALFYGDGMLTPAVSVLSAVEGLGVGSRTFQPFVLPLALIILVGLFVLQSRGTTHIGRLFGPIMVLWLAVIAVLGAISIFHTPGVLWALNPFYGIDLFVREPWTAFVTLGLVVLSVTGCEALYADMGHFGRNPIRYAWFSIVLPALVLTYFGQAAAVLRDPHAIGGAGDPTSYLFFGLVPHWAHYPMVILATVATVIASQAVISGVFSITQQAVQLGRLPRMEIRHTSATEYGQIYVPRMNWSLLVGVVLIVLIFRTSDNLTAAYGIAVSGVMVIDTFNVSIVAARRWHWGVKLAALVFGVLAFIDLVFLSANSLKIVQGGWLPLLIAGWVFFIMETWRIGRRAHLEKIRAESMPLDLLLARADKTPMRVAGTAVFLSPRSDAVPGALLHNLKHNKVLHERVIICHLAVEDVPVVQPAKRLEVQKHGKGFFTVTIHRGFFETPDVPQALKEARRFGLALDVETVTFFIGHETLVPAERSIFSRWRTRLYILLVANALSPARFFRLPPNRVVELGTQIAL